MFFRRALQQIATSAQITGNGAALTGTLADASATATTREGGWFQRPTGDARRSALNTNDLRGKILRIKVKDGDIAAADANKADLGSGTGAYTIPAGNLFPLVGGAPQAKTRPEVYAMGFRNPFRIQVDENDVAYVSDYSPDANTPQRSRGPAGIGPLRDRPQAGQLRLADLLQARRSATTSGTSTSSLPSTTTAGTPADTRRSRTTAAARRPEQRLALEPRRRPGHRARPARRAAGDRPGHLVLVPRQQRRDARSARRASATTRTTAGRRSPRARRRECPRLFPELYTGGVAPHGIAEVQLRPGQPEPEEVPAVLRRLGDPRRVRRRTRCARSSSTRRTACSRSTASSTAARPNTATAPFPFECDNPMDMQWGADGSFYLLTYGDGFFNINPDAGMYRWDYVKGKRAPKAVLTTDKTDGPLAADGQVLERRLAAIEDPGDSIRYEWDFGDGSPISTEAEPDAHLHAGAAASRPS